MFDSLQEQMQSSDMERHTVSERVVRAAAVVGVSILVFGVVYVAIMLLE